MVWREGLFNPHSTSRPAAAVVAARGLSPTLQPWVTPSYPTRCRAPSPSSAKGHGAPLGRFPMPLENFIQDLRYGVRMLRRNPLFAGAAVITLGLGLGATLAVFNVVNGVLLRPLPYRDPERINIIWFAWRGDDGNVWKLPLSSGSYSDIERDSRSFEALAAFRAWPYAIAESPDAEREAVAGARVTPALFHVLGGSPAGWRPVPPAPGGPRGGHDPPLP